MNQSNHELQLITHAVDNYTSEDDETFLRELDNTNPYVVWHAIRGVGLKRIRAAVPKLVQILGNHAVPLGEDGNTDLRTIAAWALAEIGYDSLVEYLGEIENNPNPLLREGFADTLGMTRDPRALDALDALDKLMSDPTPSVGLWAALSLSKLGEISLPVIERKLDGLSDLRRAVYLLDSLKKIGTPRAHEIARRYLEKSGSPELKDAFGE